MEAVHAFDRAVLLFVQNELRCPALDAVFVFFSLICNAGICWIALGIVLAAVRRTRAGGLAMLIGAGAETALCEGLIKHLVRRARPYTVIEELELIIAEQSTWSFPSGHAAASFACAFILTRFFPKHGHLAYIPAALIALSRVYVGVHYPTDVLAGAAFGTLVGWAVCAALRKIPYFRGTKN